jgi:hypothetical protein
MKTSIFLPFSLLILCAADAFSESEITGKALTRDHKHVRGSSLDPEPESRSHAIGTYHEDGRKDYDESPNRREQKIHIPHFASGHRNDNGVETRGTSLKDRDSENLFPRNAIKPKTKPPQTIAPTTPLGTCDNRGHLDIYDITGEECDSPSFFCFKPGLNNHCCKCRPDCCGKCNVVTDVHDPYRPCKPVNVKFLNPLVYAPFFLCFACFVYTCVEARIESKNVELQAVLEGSQYSKDFEIDDPILTPKSDPQESKEMESLVQAKVVDDAQEKVADSNINTENDVSDVI